MELNYVFTTYENRLNCVSSYFDTNRNPTIDEINVKMKNKRQKLTGSLKKNIPTRTVPAAPIPVQTAYAVPNGMTLAPRSNNQKLSVIEIKNPTVHQGFLKLSDKLRHVVNATSNNPAMISINQAIN